ncbi:MAG: ribbon-helix-helix domain-containing protein [Methylobacteriaceae bacterium]|nr:ribbon-helix-helix domain-containing protein [Methylobacteriaceae bacterium]
MCRIFSEMPTETYDQQTRSVRLGGHVTSIRLEAAFWRILEDIAAQQDVSFGRFLSKLHDEVLEFRGGAPNFASLLRCACLTYVGEVRSAPDAAAALAEDAHKSFAAPPRIAARA